MSTSSSHYLTTLTPLRGIAALIIVVFHCNLMLMGFLPAGYTLFIDNAWLWVDFFFVLSGFVMCYAYARYFSKGVTVIKYKKFIGARFARIYPLYFITTLFVFISTLFILHYATSVNPFMGAIFNPKALPACLLLIQSLHLYMTAPLNTPAWSLSTEWWAYMIFPFLVPLFIHLKTVGKTLASVILIGLFIVARYFFGPLEAGSIGATLNMIASFALVRCLAGFWLGMLFYTFYKNRAGFAIIKKDWFFVTSFLGVIVAMHFGLMDIAIILFFPFIILSAAYNDTLIKRILDTKPMQRIGDWSFSIYMVHVPILTLFWIQMVRTTPTLLGNNPPASKPTYLLGLGLCVFVVVVTVLLASLSYRYIEVPARDYLNRLFKTKQNLISAPEPEPATT